jgi:uncharacterized protein YegJ (DUF2314 family)
MGPRGFNNTSTARLCIVTCALHARMRHIIALVLMAALAACSETPPPARAPVVLADPRPEVARIAVDDPLTAAAIVTARRSAGEFLRAYRARNDGQRDFRIKMLVAERGLVEQFWVSLDSATDDSFTGTIANHPGDITGVKYGERVTVPAREISDWMYVEHGVLRGGYSVRLMRDRLQPEERPAFERELGFQID